MKLVECVPNFSEGRREEVVNQIVAEITKVPGVKLLDKEMDPDHNRSVITFVAPPEAVVEAAFNATKKAAELIDLNKHRGAHPRIGATDVIPFVPLKDITVEECVELANKLAKRIADELNIPVYLYEEAATRPERKDLAWIRKGEFEGLREAIKTDPLRKPDYGPSEVHPTAGATVVGVRKFLIAYNVNLGTNDLSIAKKIARRVRAKHGGLSAVKALGFELKNRGIVQVSMNLVDFEKSPVYLAFELVRILAERYGVPVIGSEVVGLIPQKALTQVADFYLRLENFKEDQILENKLGYDNPVEEFVTELSLATPTPGGGAASALSLALSYALISMVAGLTLKSKKYKDYHESMKKIQEKAYVGIKNALTLMKEDSEAFNEVMAAFKLPKGTSEEKEKRTEAIQNALKKATDVPLVTMERAYETIDLLKELFLHGNKNAISDVGVAALQARSAYDGAKMNVLINISSIKDANFVSQVKSKLERMDKDFYTSIDEILKGVIESMG